MSEREAARGNRGPLPHPGLLKRPAPHNPAISTDAKLTTHFVLAAPFCFALLSLALRCFALLCIRGTASLFLALFYFGFSVPHHALLFLASLCFVLLDFVFVTPFFFPWTSFALVSLALLCFAFAGPTLLCFALVCIRDTTFLFLDLFCFGFSCPASFCFSRPFLALLFLLPFSFPWQGYALSRSAFRCIAQLCFAVLGRLLLQTVAPIWAMSRSVY